MKLVVRDPNKGYLSENLWIPKAHCQVEGVKNALTFQFNEKNKVRFLTLFRETATHLVVPREFWDPTTFSFPIVDCRPKSFPRVSLKSKVRLDHRVEGGKHIPTGDSVQRDAMQALLTSRGGILQLACGKGKTVIAIDFLARREVPAIIIVDTTQLVEQWTNSLLQFLDITMDDIGFIGDGQFDWKKSVVIATYHTLGNKADTFPEEARRWFGTIIWDEAHHVAAPRFSKSADLFYGMRLGLTATPDREDGMHVVYNHHIGRVLYKNLQQDLKPKIYFKWTGLRLDPSCVNTQVATKDKNGELHIGKIATHFGQWRDRLDLILNEVRQAVAEGRKIIVLSNSVDELINLLALWNQENFLYTDIPFPTNSEVGESIVPFCAGDGHQLAKMKREIAIARTQLKDPNLLLAKRQNLEKKIHTLNFQLEQHRVWKKCEAMQNKRQKDYLQDLLSLPSNAGLMIYKVKPEERTRMLREKQVTFAVSKYGREGLDEPSLDTVIVCEPLSSRNALQQLMGRIQRRKAGKKEPVVVFLEDDIGPMIGMCVKLRTHLKTWPVDEGGPYEYEMLGHPNTMNRRKTWATASVRVSGS
jgi:superfamily II DNA or RNA helicase